MTESKPSNQAPSTVGAPIKFVRKILGVLILGALGSGLWELILRDVLFKLGNAVLSLLATLWGGYVDVLHHGIGKLRGDLLVVPIFATAIAVLVVGPWVLVYYLRRKVANIEQRALGAPEPKPLTEASFHNEIAKIRKMISWQFIPLVALFVAIIAIQVWQTQYTREASTWAEQSIEILAPNIGSQEVLRLRSQLRAVERANQFYLLEEKLREHAKHFSVDLPPFASIGKPNSRP